MWDKSIDAWTNHMLSRCHGQAAADAAIQASESFRRTLQRLPLFRAPWAL